MKHIPKYFLLTLFLVVLISGCQFFVTETYRIIYVANESTSGSVPVDGNEYKAGESVIVLGNSGNLEKYGHAFGGWNTEADGNGITYTLGKTFSMGLSDVTLYAIWDIESYTVTFNSNGGNQVPSQSVPHGEKALEPTDPSKEENTFSGWFEDEKLNIVWDFNEQVSRDITLYAKWAEIPTYMVTYYGNGNGSGSVPSDNNQYEEGQEVTIRGNTGSLIKDGYTFGGWNTEADGNGTDYSAGDSFFMGNLSIYFYAVWIENEKFQITYDGNNQSSGTPPVDNKEYQFGDTVPLLDNIWNLEKDGLRFGGWNIKSDGSGIRYLAGTDITMQSGNITLYAMWLPPLSVIYHDNNATQGEVPNDGNEYLLDATIEVQGNTGNLERTGYTFGGWNTQPNGGGTTYTIGNSIVASDSDINLYALWLENYSVLYEGNLHTSGNPPNDNTNYLEGDSALVLGNTSDLQRTGYTFGGWNTQPDGTGTSYIENDTLNIGSSDITLYALWQKNLSVFYNGNEKTSGDPPVDTIIYLEEDSVTVLDNTGNLERTGFSFVGWNTASDGSGNRYTAGQTFVMPSSDITLYAEWEINTYTITFNTDGGSIITPQEIDHGTKVVEPAIPTKQHYSFGGWFNEPELENPWNFSADVVTEDTTLYAKWDSIYPETFAGGSGTEEDPYQVETAGHLYIVRNHMDKHFIQTANIDLSAFSEGEGWEPIGEWYGDGFAENEIFVGSYDGDGYIIIDLTVNRGERDAIGLFGYVGGSATITNVTLENINIQGKQHVGGLIGQNESSGEISHCSVSGTVKGNSSYVGGLIGRNTGGNISNNNAVVDVTCCSSYAGGLIGWNKGGGISTSYATGSVTGNLKTGGLIGYNSYADISTSYATGIVTGGSQTGGLIGLNHESSDISASYATGNVTGGSQTGGLIGQNDYHGDVSASYATGNVIGGNHTGGLIGRNDSYSATNNSYAIGDVSGSSSHTGGLIGYSEDCKIYNSYARGNVEGTEQVGGLVGSFQGLPNSSVKHSFSTGAVSGTLGVGGLIGALLSGTITEAFYDTDTSGRSDSNQGTPKTTEEMMQQANFENWDFTNIWAIDERSSYPYLQWQVE